MLNRNYNLQNDPRNEASTSTSNTNNNLNDTRNEASTSTSNHSEEPLEEYFDKSLIIDESYSEDNSKSFMIQRVNNIEIISPNKDKQGVEKRDVESLKKEYEMLLDRTEKFRDKIDEYKNDFSHKKTFFYNVCKDLIVKKIDKYESYYRMVDEDCVELNNKLDYLYSLPQHTMVYDTNDDKEFRNEIYPYSFRKIKDIYSNDINQIICLYYCRQCINLAKDILSINQEMDRRLMYTTSSTFTKEAKEYLNQYKQHGEQIFLAGDNKKFDPLVTQSWIDVNEALKSDYKKAVNEYKNLIKQLNPDWIRPNRGASYQNSTYNDLNTTNPLPMMGNTSTQNNNFTYGANMSRGNG